MIHFMYTRRRDKVRILLPCIKKYFLFEYRRIVYFRFLFTFSVKLTY